MAESDGAGGLWGFQKETALRLKSFAESLGDSSTNLRVNTNNPTTKGGYLAIPKGTITAASGLTLGTGIVTLFQRDKASINPNILKSIPELEPSATRIDIEVYNYLERTFSGDPDNPALGDLVLVLQGGRGDFYVIPAFDVPSRGCTVIKEGLTAVSGGAGDVPWNNTNNVLRGVSNTAFSHTTLDVLDVSDALQVTNFELDDNIPDGVDILGIEVTLILGVGNTGALDVVRDKVIKLMKASTEVGNSLHRTTLEIWPDPGFEIPVVYGGPTTLWGETWSKADFDSGFGVSISGEDFSLDGSEARVFYVGVRVCWGTPGGGGGGATFPVIGTFSTSGQSQTMSDTPTTILGGTVTSSISDTSLASFDPITTGEITTTISGRWKVEVDATFDITGPGGGTAWFYNGATIDVYTNDGTGAVLLTTLHAPVDDTGNQEPTSGYATGIVSLPPDSTIYLDAYLPDNTWAGEIDVLKFWITYLGARYE